MVAFQFRTMNLLGETLLLWAKVTGKRPCPQFGLEDLAVGIGDGIGSEPTSSSVVVALSFASGLALPCRLVPPRES
jgi:hypothetical protein